MKKMKKLLSMLLAVVMVLAMAAPSFAGTIKIIGKDSQSLAGKTFDVYQLFSATITEDVGSDTQIAYTVNPVFKDALVEILEITTTNKTDEQVNADIVRAIEAKKENDSEVREFAEAVRVKLTDKVVTKSVTVETPTDGNIVSEYTIEGLDPGYYIIVEQNAASGATSLCMLESAGASQEITIKSDVPTIDKHIGNDASSTILGTSANVGDDIPFVLTSKVPSMEGYDNYKYIIHDTLSKGLRYKEDTAKVLVNNKEANITVTHEVQDDGTEKLTITVNNFISYANYTDADIIITYSATLTEDAIVRNKEENEVYLEYSSNPYDENETNETPKKKVYVYNFDIVIDKYVEDEENTKLANAKFVLYKDGANGTKEYYFWDSENNDVAWVSVTDADLNDALKNKIITEVTTDSSGAAHFEGLAEGTYKLLETVAPDGYNKLETPVTITIATEYNEDGTLKDNEFKTQNTNDIITVEGDGNYSLKAGIANNAGALLPSTGGIGTTIFYAAGIILMAGAVFFVVRRKRA